MTNILVTGGAGFIGSNFVRYMVNKYPDYNIINLDALTYCGNLENLKDIEDRENYSFVKGDIRDKNVVDDLVKKCDYVINFAAESHVDRSISDPEIFIKSNVLGTQVLLNASKEYGVEKYIQISTDEVYGTLGETGYFTETTPLQPNSPYSASKAGGDLITRAYFETFDLPINITRCSNNYGPYQFPEKLIPLMISNALEGKNCRSTATAKTYVTGCMYTTTAQQSTWYCTKENSEKSTTSAETTKSKTSTSSN